MKNKAKVKNARLCTHASLLLLASTVTLDSTASTNQPYVKPLTEEVLVTARKRQESSLDVPIALTVFDETTLTSPLIGNIAALDALCANVDFIHTSPLSGSSNAASVFIRGVGQNDFLLTTDPAVGIYLDGVYVARSIGGVLQLADIERVEVLRGPQGTLFGKNTMGGAIQLVSRKPSTESSASISATAGKYSRQDVKASIEGAISGHMQARLSVQSERRDGYGKRLLDHQQLGDIDRQTILAKVVWQSSDNTQWDFSLDHTHQRQEAIPQTILMMVETPISSLYNMLIANPQGTAWDERWMTNDPFTTFQTGPSEDDADITGASISAEHQFAEMTLTSITGYRRLSADYARDPDNSPLQYGHSFNHDDHKQFSQELHLSGSALDQQLDWLAGAYYFREHGKNLTEGFLFSGLYQATGNNPMFDADFHVNNDIITESSALFSQLTGHLSDRLNLTLGLRYTYEHKDFSVDNYTLNAGVQIVGPEKIEESWSELSPMLSADYQLTENSMAYISLSRGFKSGGFNGRQNFPGPIDRYDPEFATSYEVGFKSRLDTQGTSIEAAIFSTAYKDMQFTTLAAGNNTLLPLIDNAAEAKIDGAELAIIRHARQGLAFNMGIGYLNARYTDVATSTIITGKEDLVRTPEWNAHVQVAYRWPLAELGEIGLTGQASYKSKIHHDPTNIEALSEGDVTVIGAALSWQSPQAHWEIEGFVTNLTDETYLISGSAELSTFGGAEGYYAPPREWGLRASYQF